MRIQERTRAEIREQTREKTPARIRAEKFKTKDPVKYQMAYEQAREDLGLDKSIPVRYVSWMRQMLKGDFGYSTYYSRDVAELIVTPMKNTIMLNVCSMVLALMITIPLGVACAVRNRLLKAAGFRTVRAEETL